MEKFITDEILALSKAMKDDPRFKNLDELEEEVNSNSVIFALSKRKDEAEKSYSFALPLYKKGSAELTKAEHDLYEAKLAIDNEPISKKYTEAYAKVADIYREIDDIIFSPFRKKILSSLDK